MKTIWNLIIILILCKSYFAILAEHSSQDRIVSVLNRYYKSTLTKIKLSGVGAKENISASTESSLRTSRLHQDSLIYFPSSSSAKNSGRAGDKCVTFYGRIGSCQPTFSCFQETPVLQTQRLSNCGHWEGMSLICCPEYAVVKEEPMVAPPTQTVETVIPPQPMQVPLENPSETEPIPTPPTPAVVSSSIPIPTTINSEDDAQKPLSSANNSPSSVPVAQNELGETCGIFNSSDGLTPNNNAWPWIVSVGQRIQNGTIRWSCLGSLITRDYIITAAICLQEDQNVIAVGIPLLGPMTSLESKSIDIRPITQLMSHEKFVSPYMYENVGLVQMSPPIDNTPTLLPICFPFLASVLDIIHFRAYTAKTLGFETPVRRETGLEFRQIEFRILGNEQCGRVFTAKKKETLDSFPVGIKADNICGLRKDPTTICLAPGAPLVLYDEASSSHVLIGIASGDPTCSKFNRQLVTFTRMNSFSAWVRERVAFFPTPPPCYF